jgi:hypothetical protein
LLELKNKKHDGEDRADREKCYGIGHKIGVDHEDHTDHQGLEIRLLFSVNASRKTDASKDNRREDVSGVHKDILQESATQKIWTYYTILFLLGYFLSVMELFQKGCCLSK